MRILVVDEPVETAGALAESLRAATGYEVFAAGGGQAAVDLVQAHGAPDVLITEVVMEGLDGFKLREALLHAHPPLRTIYLTGYDLSAYAEYIGEDPVLYKPADVAAVLEALPRTGIAVPNEIAPAAAAAFHPGLTTRSITTDQRTRSARLRRLVEKQGFTGKLDQFELVDIIQMCCISKRTGKLSIARKADRGVIYLKSGQIIDAVSGELQSEEAVYEIIGWSSGQFNFEDGVQPANQTLSGGWEHLVMEGVRRRDERQQASAGDDAPGADPLLADQNVGPYRLRRKLGQGTTSQVFEALQTSMDRVVALKVLRPDLQQDDAEVQRFLAEASAKANVQHPSILAVYEAGHADDFYYYAREFVDGDNLTGLHAQGRTIDDSTALQLIKVASEALSYLSHNKIPHAPIAADDLYLGRDRHPRLNNIAIVPDRPPPTAQQDMHSLSRMVADCLPGRSAATAALRALLGRMLIEGSGGFLSWGALLQAVRGLEPKVVPEDAFKLSAQDAMAIAAVREAKKRQKRGLLLSTVGMFLLFWLIAAVVYVKFMRAPQVIDYNKMVEVPAGEFTYQSDEKMSLPAFQIDEYEVTIGQYAQFLAALKARPTAEYDHPDQPKGRMHENPAWINLYRVAASGGKFRGAQVNVNYPAIFVDWFDAYAYARWKGRRLPTEYEWEKAARGTDGRKFPWGNDPALISKVNTSADYHERDGAAKGEVDGYNFWSPVDAMTGDKSPYGVMDMAGNVSEWTATVLGKDHPVVRGGNYGSDSVEVTRRFTGLFNIQGNDRIGFRTAK